MPDETDHHHSHPCQPSEDHPETWLLNPGKCDRPLPDGTVCGKTYAETRAEKRLARALAAVEAAKAGASRG